ncbi:MAG TPA: LysM peptidoglycan-binding domain-containing protein [Longimicrobium sp.]|nr:LysM peptidoglycan-binding domain-containing protein [Longimicrobium sp.]
MRSSLVAAIAGLAAAAPLAAQQQPAQQERVHVVRQGDTLWELARTYMSDPFLWPEIFRLNTDVVQDPARIYPSERLLLPGGAREGAAPDGPRDGRTVFYRDEEAEDRAIFGAATAPYSIVTQGDYYRASFVAPDAEVRPVGRLAEVISPTEVALDRLPGIQPYDRVYVAMAAGSGTQVGDRFHFVRPARDLRPAGRVWESTGMATVAAVEDGVATAVMIRVFDEVRPGDLALPAARFPVPVGVRPVASTGLQGRLLGLETEHPIVATMEYAFLDVGRQAGVREGDEFEVYLPREARSWGSRPEIRVGRMQVVKVMDRTATVKITAIEQPAMRPGLPVRRVARMP